MFTVPVAVIPSIRSAISDMLSKENKLKFLNKTKNTVSKINY